MLSVIGLIAIVVITIQVYKTARNTERNAAMWAIIAAVIGLGLQFVLPIAMTAVLAVYYIMTGTPVDEIETALQGPASLVGLLGIVLSIVGLVLVTRHVAKVVDDGSSARMPPPPPPPMFDRST